MGLEWILIITLELILSWMIIRFFEKSNLSVLGLWPTQKRISDFFLFLLVTGFCCTIGFLLKIYLGGEVWGMNPDLNFSKWIMGTWNKMEWVFMEELLFRGILFYIIWKRLGPGYAIFLSALFFGIYHWFTFGILGNYSQMIKVFLMTASLAVLYGYAFTLSKSLYSTLAMHFGWVYTLGFLFSGDLGVKGIWIPSINNISTHTGIKGVIINVSPLLLNLILNYFLLRFRNQRETSFIS